MATPDAMDRALDDLLAEVDRAVDDLFDAEFLKGAHCGVLQCTSVGPVPVLRRHGEVVLLATPQDCQGRPPPGRTIDPGPRKTPPPRRTDGAP